jgi:hypothetical protein
MWSVYGGFDQSSETTVEERLHPAILTNLTIEEKLQISFSTIGSNNQASKVSLIVYLFLSQNSADTYDIQTSQLSFVHSPKPN